MRAVCARFIWKPEFSPVQAKTNTCSFFPSSLPTQIMYSVDLRIVSSEEKKFLHFINLENSEYLKMVSLEFALRKPNRKAGGLWWLVRTSWFWLSQGPCRRSHSKGKCCKFNHVWAVWHHDNKFPHNSQILFSPMTTSFRAVWNAHLFFSGFKTARNFCFHCQASSLRKLTRVPPRCCLVGRMLGGSWGLLYGNKLGLCFHFQ